MDEALTGDTEDTDQARRQMHKSESASEPTTIKSAQRALEILECFRERREPLNATAVAQALDYPQSSTLLLLKTLAHLDYLTFDQQVKTYFPSPRVALLGDWIDGTLFGNQHALDAVHRMNADFGETAYIAVQKDLMVQYVYSVPGSHPLTLTITPGFRNPLFASSVGRAILSTKSNDTVARLIERFNETVASPRAVLAVNKVIEVLEEVRTRGYAGVYDTVLEGTGGIAVPVPSSLERNVYALGVGGPSQRIRKREKEIADRMVEILGI